MYLKYFGNKSFKLCIISALILLENLRRCIATRPDDDDQLVIPHNINEDTEILEGARENNCHQKLLELKNELDSLKENLKIYNESQLEAFYFVSERIGLILKAVKMEEDYFTVVRKQIDFLQDHILDVGLLKTISQRILSSLLENAGDVNTTGKILSIFPMVTFGPTNGDVQLKLFEFLFDHLESIGYLDNLSNLEKLANLMKEMFLKIKATNETSPLPSSLSKERDVKLVSRLIVNLVSQNDGESLTPRVRRWLNGEFFASFLHLSEGEVYEVVLDTLETQFEDKLLTYEQLQYVKLLYYESFPVSYVDPKNLHFLNSPLQTTSAKRDQWRQRKELFSRPLVFNSIDRDILSRVTTNLTDGPTIGLQYLENELLDAYWSYNDLDEDDIWFCRVVEVILHAMQNETPLTYDPNQADYWKLIQYFGNAKSVLAKYPFLVDNVKSFIFDTYGHQKENLGRVFKFLQTVPRIFVLEGVRQLLSLMREDGHLNEGQEVFQLADFMMTSNLHNQSIWNELPEQVQLLCDYSRDKGLLWFFKSGAAPLPSQAGSGETQTSLAVGDDDNGITYEIFVDDEFSIGLKPLSRTDDIIHPNEENQQQEELVVTENDAKRIWRFDTTFVPSANQARTQISLADTSPSHGGVVAGPDEGGNRILRHVRNFRDRRHGKFTTFQPILSNNGESFQLHFDQNADHYVSALHSSIEPPQSPIGLVLTSKFDSLSSPPAEFTVQRQPQ